MLIMANKSFRKARKLMAETKMRIQRSMSYLAIINSGMILFLMLSKLKEFGIDIQLTHWYLPVFIISIIGAIAVGHIDVKLGFLTEEAGAVSRRNPVLTEIQEKLERIESKLNKSKLR